MHQVLWYKKNQAPTLEEKISKSLIHSFVFSNYRGLAINPYQGCAHRCAYCYATYEWSPEFYDKIYAKSNAPEILDKQLATWKSDSIGPVMVGSATDAYQHAEARYGLTRRCVEVLQKHDVPYYVFTKSTLISRDLDLHSTYRDNCVIIWSITTANEYVRRIMEPGTPPTEKLFDTINRFAEEGIACGVNIDPIIPLVTDSKEELHRIASCCKDAGLSHVFGSVLRIRSDIWARVKTLLDILEVPDWHVQYSVIYGLDNSPDEKGYGMASEEYDARIMARLHGLLKTLGLKRSFPKALGMRKLKRAMIGQSLLQEYCYHPNELDTPN
jgi:DNA repair photolyase